MKMGTDMSLDEGLRRFLLINTVTLDNVCVAFWNMRHPYVVQNIIIRDRWVMSLSFNKASFSLFPSSASLSDADGPAGFRVNGVIGAGVP